MQLIAEIDRRIINNSLLSIEHKFKIDLLVVYGMEVCLAHPNTSFIQLTFFSIPNHFQFVLNFQYKRLTPEERLVNTSASVDLRLYSSQLLSSAWEQNTKIVLY